MDVQLTDISQQGRIQKEILRDEGRGPFGEDARVKSLWDRISLELAKSPRRSRKRDLTIKAICLESEGTVRGSGGREWMQWDLVPLCMLFLQPGNP